MTSYFSDPVNRIIKKIENLNNILIFIQINDPLLREHGVWLVSNITSDSVDGYNIVLNSGIYEKFCDYLNEDISLRSTIILAHFFKNLYKLKRESIFKPVK